MEQNLTKMGTKSCFKKQKSNKRNDKWPDTSDLSDEELTRQVTMYVTAVTHACQEAMYSPRCEGLEDDKLRMFVKKHVLTVLDCFRSDTESKTNRSFKTCLGVSASPSSGLVRSLTPGIDSPFELTSHFAKGVRSNTWSELTPTQKKRKLYRPAPFLTYRLPENYTGIPPSFCLPTPRLRYFRSCRKKSPQKNESEGWYQSKPPPLFEDHEIMKFSYHLLHRYYHCTDCDV